MGSINIIMHSACHFSSPKLTSRFMRDYCSRVRYPVCDLTIIHSPTQSILRAVRCFRPWFHVSSQFLFIKWDQQRLRTFRVTFVCSIEHGLSARGFGVLLDALRVASLLVAMFDFVVERGFFVGLFRILAVTNAALL